MKDYWINICHSNKEQKRNKHIDVVMDKYCKRRKSISFLSSDSLFFFLNQQMTVRLAM